MALAALADRVRYRLQEAAAHIAPPPPTLAVFGSFARGEARSESDIDVLAVRPDEVAAADPSWSDSLGRWTDKAREITGNPVNLIEAQASEIPHLLAKRSSVWREIANQGTTLIGVDVGSLVKKR